MSPQHTPGPWLADDVEGCIGIAADSDGEILAYLAQPHQQTNARNAAETQANARLIAAAPELLEALHALLSVIDAITARESSHYVADMATSLETCEQMAAARAAIAKATGSAA